MISIENVDKSFGARTIFDGISFTVNPRERIGLVGRNGHGKTTLMRMLVDEQRPDNGRIKIPKNYRIGYVTQQLAFSADTVLAEGMRGLPANERDHHWKVEKILEGLGFDTADMQRHPLEFSGGYQVRLNLAKVLVSEPDLLLLDEPTNYLDITSIRWIERFLRSWPRELLLITHDRSFMDRVVTHVTGIHHCKVRKIQGDTGKYYAQIAQDEEIYEKTRVNDEKRRREIEQFITRFRAKARLANLVQSRIKTLAKMEKRQKLEKMQSLEFAFRALAFPAKQMATIEQLAFGYDSAKALISDLNLNVAAGDRICIVGQNGRGKTTLLKLLAGVLPPSSGGIDYHPAVTAGYFEQTHVQGLADHRTVEEEILYAHGDMDRQRARNICGSMMFSGDDALKKISVLSGGEKSRVMLGQLLATPLNLLLLDEPTNHLDMDACDALLAALDAFEGALVLVTHNEMFLHALAQRLIVFRDQGIEVFDGDYQHFLEQGGWGDDTSLLKPGPQAGTPVDAGTLKASRKQLRQQRSKIVRERSKVLKPLERKISSIESDIEERERALTNDQQQLVEASRQQDADAIARLSQELHGCQGAIDTLYEQLEGLAAELEREQAKYDVRLAGLNGDSLN